MGWTVAFNPGFEGLEFDRVHRVTCGVCARVARIDAYMVYASVGRCVRIRRALKKCSTSAVFEGVQHLNS